MSAPPMEREKKPEDGNTVTFTAREVEALAQAIMDNEKEKALDILQSKVNIEEEAPAPAKKVPPQFAR